MTSEASGRCLTHQRFGPQLWLEQETGNASLWFRSEGVPRPYRAAPAVLIMGSCPKTGRSSEVTPCFLLPPAFTFVFTQKIRVLHFKRNGNSTTTESADQTGCSVNHPQAVFPRHSFINHQALPYGFVRESSGYFHVQDVPVSPSTTYTNFGIMASTLTSLPRTTRHRLPR